MKICDICKWKILDDELSKVEVVNYSDDMIAVFHTACYNEILRIFELAKEKL